MVLLELGEAEEVAGDGQDGGVELPAGEVRVEVEERAGREAGAEAEDGAGGAAGAWRRRRGRWR